MAWSAMGDNEKKPRLLHHNTELGTWMSTLEGKVHTVGDKVLGHAYTGTTGRPLCQLPPPTLPALQAQRETRKMAYGPEASVPVQGRAWWWWAGVDKDRASTTSWRMTHTGLPRIKGFMMKSSYPKGNQNKPKNEHSNERTSLSTDAI